MTTSLSDAPRPPITFLTLPLDIKKEIFDHLMHDRYPTLAILRRTHSSFVAAIPKSDLRTKPTKDELRQQLVTAYYDFNYLLPVNHVPCYYCTLVEWRDGGDYRWLKTRVDWLKTPVEGEYGECEWKKVPIYECRTCQDERSSSEEEARGEYDSDSASDLEDSD